MSKRVLLTGGLGFIGSHTALALNEKHYETVIVDNLSNSKKEVYNKIQTLCQEPDLLQFYEGDVTNKPFLNRVFQEEKPDAVIHFASLKSVKDSIEDPYSYYYQNLNGLLSILETMKTHNCNRIVFSSSATVYGESQKAPLYESMQIGQHITNPYGQTKYFQEVILQDYSKANPQLNVLLLRYFNPVGAHESGLLGEDPNGIPSNLFPFVMRVASGQYEELQIFGNDYDTKDGTCIRDFIHVMDLAEGHVASLKQDKPGCHVYNLGTGQGTTVLELVEAFEKTNKVVIPRNFQPRRCGDVDIVYSDASKAKEELQWTTKRSLETICKDGYHFVTRQSKHH